MTKYLTVFVDGHSFDTGWQGTTTYLTGILNELPGAMARCAPEVKLRLVCSAEKEENIRQHVTTPFEFVSIRGGFLRRNGFDIPRALCKTGADLVVSQYVRPFFAPCQTLSVIHDVLFLDLLQSFSWKYRLSRYVMFGWSARHSSLVSSVSTYSAERIEAHFGVSANSIPIIPNAVDLSFLAAERQPWAAGTPLRLISVSRLERRKRHEWGIAAQEALACAGFESELTIIGGGDGPYAEDLRAEVEAAQNRGLNVMIRSSLPFSELVEAYARSHIFIFPAEAEGFGIPVIEAAGAGIPGVVSDGGALADFEGHFVGELFPAADKQAFIDAVLRVAENLDEFREMAEVARQQVGKTYSWRNAANNYAEIFKTIAESKP
ncbi:glycosyltransferase family 4 protein [Sulfitobacter pseudonitzschiae]|uniref:Glycosyltransferase family 4 protein n=1 Tax=Pseudosulfitobacter pseudonitzschiae TaxID=1402135 RepID=A0A9Q2NM83_9RHOB|nr:glycosyltransferase family 1 protein [Pseudosulfitobacter pseudonitzschiae]MBM2294569.1 glycosyltransferase family 4 protein [Pseudosulfitobacter pseudonitzschiae]MBM2299536.1 glycosyltransferase family 4 protein [Pseudosulfitobacter pseudonitzschiae]MBM2304436.1 glycosyltransferase family 4 protein [Pseudosulfitobacter pseudonitzschiae]MBM2314182.1 glycosyltransferase family 4 protein [Pseudosulfitobacter pseudonitzschiae]MBM2319097.1 glycosyltransferase family 4 protein [Pseudosulfitobact